MERLRRRRAATVQEAPEVGHPQPAEAGGSRSVQLIYGPVAEQLDLAGLGVEEARRLLQAPFHIAPAAPALVNGRPCTPDQVLRAGDILEFTRRAGEKGGVL